MNVAIVVGSVSRTAGGVFDVTSRLATGLASSNGCSVRVLGLRDREASADLQNWPDVSVTALRGFARKSFGYAPSLVPALLAANADIVHQHGLWMYHSIACRRWAWRTHRPYIISPHGHLDSWAINNSRWKKRVAGCLYQTRSLRGAACLHALTSAEASAIRSYGLTNPICVVPNGVHVPDDLHGLPPTWENEVTRGKKILLFLGRMNPQKNLRSLLGAWSQALRVSRNGSHWRLVLAGWDQYGYQGQLEKSADDLGIRDTVQFVGPQFGIAKHATLCRASAFVLPSVSEGLPVAVLEAWAYGIPVMMTAHCNLPEGFELGAAIQCSAESNSLAGSLATLFDLPNKELCSMGSRGRQLVDAHFTWPNVITQIMEVYAWLVGARKRPQSVTV